MRWLTHPLFAPVLVLAALGWGTLVLVFLLVAPGLGPWTEPLLAYCFGWSPATRAYRLDALLLYTLEPPLFALAVGFFYRDELAAFARRLGGRLAGGAVGLGFVTAAALLATTGDVVAWTPSAASVDPVRQARPAPAAGLSDHRGRPFALGVPDARPVALTFFYADCHAACPALLATLRSAEALAGGRARFVAVTLDPARDTVAVLAAQAARWELSPAWHLLTGAPGDVARLLDAYGVQAVRLPDGEIAHPSLIVLLDRAGRIAATYRGLGHRPADLAAALSRLAAERG